MAQSVRKFKETVELRSGFFMRIRSHRHFSTGLMLAALLVVACFHIWQRVQVIRLVQDVAILKDENKMLVDETKKARTAVAALEMASRVQSCAADSLGLEPIVADRLFTIELRTEGAIMIDTTDELATVVSSVKRIADYLPVMSEARAVPAELRRIRFDSLEAGRNTR